MDSVLGGLDEGMIYAGTDSPHMYSIRLNTSASGERDDDGQMCKCLVWATNRHPLKELYIPTIKNT